MKCAFSSSLTTTVISQRSMRWFDASPRRATPKGHNLHHLHSTASRSPTYIELLSALVAHPRSSKFGLSRKRSGQPGAFAGLLSFCRSARRAKSAPGRDACATENTRRSFRPWTRCRRCSGCGGRKGSGPPTVGGDPRAKVPLVIREGNLVTEGDDLLGGGGRGFAPNADSASLTVLKVQVGAEHISTHSGYAVVMADRVRRRRCLALGRGGGCRGRATGIRMRPGRRR